jgi:hypothetical protein
MPRHYVSDGVEIYRAQTYYYDGRKGQAYGPYDSVGKAKAQGTRETHNRHTSFPKYYVVQKLVAVLDEESKPQLAWEDVYSTKEKING